MGSNLRSSGSLFVIFAAIVFAAYVGVLVKLNHDAGHTSAPGSTAAAAVERAYKARIAAAPLVVRQELHDVGCEANPEPRTFTCHLFLSPDGKRGLIERYVLRPVAHCTGEEHCLQVGAAYYSLNSSGETRVTG